MKKPRWTKKQCEQSHARRRALERFGIRLTHAQIHEHVQAIKEGRYEFVEKQSIRVSLWRTSIDGVPVVLVYDRERKTIITVLKNEWLEKGVCKI